MSRNKGSNIVLCVLMVIVVFNLQGQYIANGAMDAPETGDDYPPYFWFICENDGDPTLYDAFEPYDGEGDLLYSTDFSTFVLIRTRGLNYITNDHPIPSFEHMSTKLLQPLLKDHCYEFSVDLAHRYSSRIADSEEPNYAYPVTVQVWGCLDSCSQDELLFETHAVDNDEFQRFNFNFHVKENDYPFIYVRASWDTINIKPDHYSGIVFMDNMNIQHVRPVGDPVIKQDTFTIDPVTIVVANQGVEYFWQPMENVPFPYIQGPDVVKYTDTLYLKAIDDEGCPFYEKHALYFNCDQLYPKPYREEMDVYYQLDGKLQLSVSKGEAYSWEPEEFISDTGIYNPYLIDFTEEVIADVTDEYGCHFYKKYNVLIDCDVMYPNDTLYMLDTLVEEGNTVQLKTTFGELSQNWKPNTYLSCSNCLTPVASPVSTTNYLVQLKDVFDCEHYESFKIEIPMFIPNIITPNGDGKNDVFKIKGLPEDSEVSIFDKNGYMVFRKENYGYEGELWSGTNKNGEILYGTYWYIIEYKKGSIERGFIFVK